MVLGLALVLMLAMACSNTDDDDGCSATCTVEENGDLEDDNPTIDFGDFEVGDTVVLNAPDPTQDQSFTLKNAADPDLCTCTWSINPTTRGSFSDETVCQADFTLAEAGNANLQVSVDCGDDGSGTYNQTLTIAAASSDSGGGGSGGCSLIRYE